MKKFIIILFILLAYNFSHAEPPLWEYSKFTHWEYDLNFKVVILFPEEFELAVDYYFSKESEKIRRTVVAFTVYHGNLFPVMFTQAKMNLSPSNDDLGHELKHIINRKHVERRGYDRFPLPCSHWK